MAVSDSFEIRWISTNNPAEGTGKPNNPTTDGITYNDEPGFLLNPTGIASFLGTFVTCGTDGVVRLPLSTNATFVRAQSLRTGQVASIILTATSNSTVGFTFHSRNFVDPTQFPYLEVTAVPIPRITPWVSDHAHRCEVHQLHIDQRRVIRRPNTTRIWLSTYGVR